MKFKIKLNTIENKLFSISGDNSKIENDFTLFNEHTGASSDLYLSNSRKLLLKIERCKYNYKCNPWRWFFRDFFKKLCVIKLGARKEFKGYKTVSSAGLNTPAFYCWGTTLSPFSSIFYFMIVEFKSDVVSGFVYFYSLSEHEKTRFINKLGGEVATLAKKGYIHRDLHLNNFIIDSSGKIFWVDIHLRKLSWNQTKRDKQIESSLVAHQLGGEQYKEIIYNIINNG